MQTVIMNRFDILHCILCPKKCGADRTKTSGICGGGNTVRAARSALHFGEEPCISGRCGSGTIFFSGCSLRCCFCQNHIISQENFGMELTVDKLSKCILDLQEKGAHNINFVTGTHYVPWIIEAVIKVKPKLDIPIVWNSSGYETVETLKMLEGIVDIYLPDFKYIYRDTARNYSQAEDYPEIAEAAIVEMYRQVGTSVINSDGLMEKGIIVRHLVLPGHRHESMAILKRLSEIIPKENFLLSLMGQYTPPESDLSYKNLNRKLTTMEYQSVLKYAENIGFEGFSQDLSSAKALYTPIFNLEGLLNE